MAIDPVKIPQNVYIEDRIVGPLTLRQTMIMALGGGLSYGIYIVFAKANGGHLGYVGTALAWVPCGIAVIFALIRINDLSLFRMLLLLIERLNKPSKRLWAPRKGLTIHIRTNSTIEEKTPQQVAAEKQAQETSIQTESKIQELSTLLDRPLTPVSDEAQKQPPSTPEAAAEPEPEERSFRLPVDPKRISAEDDSNDDLSAYRGVFRDISPS